MILYIYDKANPNTRTEFKNVTTANVSSINAEIATVDIVFKDYTSTAKEYDPTKYGVWIYADNADE